MFPFSRLTWLLIALAVLLVTANMKVHAQELEPRAYSNTPLGMNFLLFGYLYSEGALLFDPAIPITDANAHVKVGLLAYARTLGIAGKSAKAGMVLPYADLSASGLVEGNYRTRDTSGLVDPAFFFTINLFGAPALSLKEFVNYQQDTIIGFTFKMTAPLGQYDNSKVINIGTNRWSFEPELGISQAMGRWTFEASAAALFYTDNDDFNGGQTRSQDPIYSAQGHVIYSFHKRMWAAFSATYYEGGQTTIDGINRNDQLDNWRTGFTVALPINRNNAVKVYGHSGVSTRTGTDYDSIGVAWQHHWGGGT